MSDKLDFLPNSFADRGVYMPFTTPELAFCRIRYTVVEDLEVLISGLTDDFSVYVVPVARLRNIINLSVFDRCILEILEIKGFNSPNEIRHLCAKVMSSGLGGAEYALKKTNDLHQDAHQKQESLMILMQMFYDQMALITTGNENTISVKTKDGSDRFRRILSKISPVLGLSIQQITTNLEIWSNAISPICSANGLKLSFYGNLAKELQHFAKELTVWVAIESPQIIKITIAIIEVLYICLTLAEKLIETVTAHAKNIMESLKNWQEFFPILENEVLLITQFLDGWSQFLDNWNNAKKFDRRHQQQSIKDFFYFVPFLPADIIGDNTKKFMNLRTIQKEWKLLDTISSEQEVAGKLRGFPREML